jgi:hypothetical protein
LLQVRALPPEQVKVDVDRTLRRGAAADPPGAGHDPFDTLDEFFTKILA